jgi:ribonuclease III
LLDLALTHPTASSEANYEQLEFVGDAVVRLAASQFLWDNYSDKSLGEFSEIRANLASDRILAQIADSYNLERYLLMDKSAAADSCGRDSRLADALEAILGAFFLSTNTLELVRPWLDSHFHQIAAEILADPALRNYKAALQELTQSAYKILPEYQVKEVKIEKEEKRCLRRNSPPPNKTPTFVAEVKILGKLWGTGTGSTKKAAEQAAAKQAFEQFRTQDNGASDIGQQNVSEPVP